MIASVGHSASSAADAGTSAGAPAESDLLARLLQSAGGEITRHVGATGGSQVPGVLLFDDDRLAGAAGAAAWDDRAGFVRTLAALVRAFHACGAVVGEAWPRLRWVDGPSPAPWLPLYPAAPGETPGTQQYPDGCRDGNAARSSARRSTRSADRAELAGVAERLLAGPECPPEIASLIRRAGLASSAAPLPVEWVLALGGRLAGRVDPAPWIDKDLGGRSLGPVNLTLVVLGAGAPPATTPGWWAGLPRGPRERFIVVAGRHAEQLVLALHGPDTPLASVAATPVVGLEPGPQLEANVRAHAQEASLLLEADGIPLGHVEILFAGDAEARGVDVAGLRAAVRGLLVS